MRKFSPLRPRFSGRHFFLAACLLLAPEALRADTVLLKGGERVIGKVLDEQPEKVRFESRALGVLEIPRDRIERIEHDEPPPPPPASTKVVPGPAPSTAAAEAAVERESITPPPPTEPAGEKTAAVTPPETIVPLPPATPAGGATEPGAATPPVVSPPLPVVAPPEVTAPPVVAAPPAATAQPVVNGTRVELVPVVKAVPQTAPPVVAQEPAPPVKPPPPAPTTVFYPWSGLGTDQDTYDWIQLKSGEWLKGKIKGMQDFELEFDSEKMNLQTFDWKDIRLVRSPRLNSVWFGKAGTAAGSLLITKDEVKVISTSGTTTYLRSDLLAITPTGLRERNLWSAKLFFGLSLRAGNTQETDYNASATLQRRTPLTRLKLEYLGNYTDINGVVSEENERATASFDYFFSRQLYMRLPDAEFYRDPVQNISGRVTLGGAVGYDIFRTQNFEWDVAAGPAYQDIKFISVQAGQSQEERSLALVFGTRMDWQVTDKIEWILDYRGQFTGKDSDGGTTQHLNSTVEFEIHKRLKLNISFIWDRVGSPKADANGVVPKPDDFRLNTSLGIDL